MNAETTMPQTREGYAAWIGRAISILTTLVALGGACLFLAGNVSYTTRLRDLGVPSDLFPLGIEATMVAGYYAIALEWAEILLSPRMLLMALGFIAYGAALAFIRRHAEALQVKGESGGTAKGPKPPPSWPRLALNDIWSIATAVVLIGGAAILLTFLAITPAYMGEVSAHARAERLARCFEVNADAGRAREELIDKDDRVVAKGFLIAASNQHLAIYDITSKTARVLAREDLEIRARALPYSREAAKSSPDLCM